jgi:SAM-dependent methyltransferase
VGDEMPSRTIDRVRDHYLIERKLADRLRDAPEDQRSTVYGEVYDELFRSVPDHPQLSIDHRVRERHVLAKLRFVSRFLTKDSCLMEIGAGDCLFSINAAPRIRRGVVVDVSKVIVAAAEEVANLDIVITDGVSLPVEPGSVDVAYSDQLMEHLHPDDAVAQLENVARAIRPGGVYVCITPNRLSGPHDVSRGFDEVATSTPDARSGHCSLPPASAGWIFTSVIADTTCAFPPCWRCAPNRCSSTYRRPSAHTYQWCRSTCCSA